jgi:uncharacterized protein involved in outer membrane biogenesis
MAKHRVGKFFLCLLVLLLVLIGVAGALVFFVPGKVIRQIAGDKGSAALDRSFSIDGPISIDWDWTNPYVHLSDIRLANTKGAKDPDMVAIGRLDFHIKIWRLLEGQLNLPDITIEKPDIVLEKYADDTANWQFPALSGANAATSAALPSKRSNFPILGQLTINNGKLVYRDIGKKIDVTLGIQTASGGGGEKGNFILSGQGKLQGKPFDIHAQGGSLQLLRDSKEQYPLHLHVKMGDTAVDVDGTFLDPVQMEGIDTKLAVRGDNLADLFYLTMLPLPPTPAYDLTGHLTKQGDLWTFENFSGKVGGSDLGGHLTDDISGKRSFLKAELHSKMLDMKDLAGFTGATPAPRKGDDQSSEQVQKATEEKANPKLIPDVPLDLSRLRASDMDVSLEADKILAPHLPIDNMNMRFLLKDGVLRIDPLEFGMASGKISGSLVLDGSKDMPHVESDLMLTRLHLREFFKGTQFEALTKGSIGGHFQLAGDGKSLADVMADANGRVTFLMSGGTMSQLIVDAAGLDVGGAATDLLGSDKSAGIRCAVLDFPVTQGILDSKIFVIDTTISTIGGHARIDLRNETIDGKIETEPKSPTITAHAPILISGDLKHPSIGLDPKEAAARGVAAGVLSVFLTPLAGIIPFIETGLGTDSDCNGLVGQARAHMQAVPTEALPTK